MDVLAALLPSAVVGGAFVYAVVRVVRAEGGLRGARRAPIEDESHDIEDESHDGEARGDRNRRS